MDQNTTTIVVGLIVSITGLTGSLGSIYINNRHAAKMDMIKRTNALIEEVYQDLHSTNDLIVSFCYKANQAKEAMDIVSKIEEIKSSTIRPRTLIKIYSPSLKPKIEEYMGALKEYWDAIGRLQDGKGTRDQEEITKLRMDTIETGKKYKEKFDNILVELEKLVK